MKYKYLIILISFLGCVNVLAQKDSIQFEGQMSGIVSTGKNSPFLFQSQNYGKYTDAPTAGIISVGIGKDFSRPKSQLDFSFKFNGLLRNSTTNSPFYVHEYYGKCRLWVFDLTAGAKEEILGTQDSTLSGGGILFSKNSRPMPKITAGIEKFTAIPLTGGYLEIKGAISHGWFDNNIVKNEFLHHKYAYIRVGGKLPVRIQYGIDHVAQWGGLLPNGSQQPSSFSDFIYVFKAGHGGSNAGSSEQVNTLGNHIISQSLKLEVDANNFRVSAYWQNINEDPPVKFIASNEMNIKDGLWGVSIRNNEFPFIKGILYEYLNTTDQSGTLFQKDGIIYGGSDNYFANYLYNNGWNYMGKTIGTPYIGPNTPKWPSSTNNRVCVQHVGIEGETNGYNYRLMASYSKNYGAYTSMFPKMIENTSTMLEIKKTYKQLYNIEVGCTIGADFGGLYGNTLGCMLSIRKRGNLFKY
jgi:Capsule assembly protein Wzi